MFRRFRRRMKREDYIPSDLEIYQGYYDKEDDDIFCCGQAMDVDTFYGYNECLICGKTKPLTREQKYNIEHIKYIPDYLKSKKRRR